MTRNSIHCVVLIIVAVLFQWICFTSGCVFGEVEDMNCTEWICSESPTENKDGSRCRCDKACMLYGDCCYDFFESFFIHNNVTEFLTAYKITLQELSDSNPYETYWVSFVKKYGVCHHNFGVLKSESYKMITLCPIETEKGLKDKCEEVSEDFMTEVPVSYIGIGKVHVAFRNMYCAMCHEIQQESIIPWSVHIQRNCLEEENINSSVQIVLPLNRIYTSCIDIKTMPIIDFPFRFLCFPDNMDICKDQEIEKGEDAELVCDTYYHRVTVNISEIDFSFKNPHCIPCSSQRNFDQLTCTESDDERLHPSLEDKLDINLVALFDFRRGLTVQINKQVYVRTDDLCDSNYIYDTILQTCIELMCPDSQRLSSSGCIYNEESWNIVSDSLSELAENKSYEIVFKMESYLRISDIIIESFKNAISEIDNDLFVIALYYELLDVINETKAIDKETTTRESRRGNKGGAVVKHNEEKTPSTTTQSMQHFAMSTTSIDTKDNSELAQYIDDVDNRTESHTTTSGFSTTLFDSDNSESLYIYVLNVIVMMEGKINGKLDKILGSLSSISEILIDSVTVKTLNYTLDCTVGSDKYVKMNSMVKMNGYYYGVDNGTRALVDIDKTEFEIHLNHGQVTFSDMNYCKIDTLNCTMGLYKLSDFTSLDNGTLVDKVSNRVFGKQNYLMRGTNVLICINLSAVLKINTPEIVSKHETILSIIVEAISVFCLYTTGILYSGCFGIKSCNSRSIMFLSLTLGTAQCLFFIPASSSEITCKIKAVALHFFWLSSFFWMSVIGFDYAKTFRIGKTEVRQQNNFLDLKYAVFASGIPIFFIAVCLCVDELMPGQVIGYGVDVCWIGKSNSYFIVFAVPVLTIIFVNISFFTCTVVGIYRAKFNKSNEKIAPKRSLFVIYIKLCLMMGLTWIVAFIAGYFNVDFLWVVHILMNGLQGVDIFLTFVLNKRAIQALGNRTVNKYSTTNKHSLDGKVSANSLSSTTNSCTSNETKF